MTTTDKLRIILKNCERGSLHDIDVADALRLRQEYPYSLDMIGYINDQPVHIERLYASQEYRDRDIQEDYRCHDYELLFVPNKVLVIPAMDDRKTEEIKALLMSSGSSRMELVEVSTHRSMDPRDLAAAAGYYRHIDVERLTADVRKYPGCEDLKARNMQNYLARNTKMPPAVIRAFAVISGQSIETIMKSVKG